MLIDRTILAAREPIALTKYLPMVGSILLNWFTRLGQISSNLEVDCQYSSRSYFSDEVKEFSSKRRKLTSEISPEINLSIIHLQVQSNK